MHLILVVGRYVSYSETSPCKCTVKEDVVILVNPRPDPRMAE